MIVNIENTPNKNIIKFVANRPLVEGSFEISREKPASNIPISEALLQFPFVENIFITANFIAIQKNDDNIEWEMVQKELKEIINDELLAVPTVVLPIQNNAIDVYLEVTPNGEVMKFITNKVLLEGMVELKSIEQAKEVPLAEYLFGFPYVNEVFISSNFVSINKKTEYKWEDISLEIRSNIAEYLKQGKEISKIKYFSDHTQHQENYTREYSETEQKIKALLEEYVIPAVSGDGGNIDLVSFDEESKTATMILQGACSGCPSSTMTLKSGIESLLKQMLPNEVERVVAVNG